MTEIKGTKNIKEMLDLALAMYGVGKGALADGHLGLEDLFLIRDLVPVVGPALADAGEIIPEFKDLSIEEGSELVAYTMSKLNIENAKAQAIVTDALAALAANYKLYKSITMQDPSAPVVS